MFDMHIGAGGPSQNQLYGYWSRSETCFELHVSSMGCSAFADLTLPNLRSVEIIDQPDVTLDTVMMARLGNKLPTDREIHRSLAGIYLHQANSPNTELARRYYKSVLRLSPGRKLPQDHWMIQAGLGLTMDHGRQWLQSLTGGSGSSVRAN